MFVYPGNICRLVVSITRTLLWMRYMIDLGAILSKGRVGLKDEMNCPGEPHEGIWWNGRIAPLILNWQ